MDKVGVLLLMLSLIFGVSFTAKPTRRNAPLLPHLTSENRRYNDVLPLANDATDDVIKEGEQVEDDVIEGDSLTDRLIPKVTLDVKHTPMQSAPKHVIMDQSAFIQHEPGLDPLQEILTYMRMLSDDMTSLRTQVTNLKYDNHLLYKQLKKLQIRCSVNDVIDPPNKYQQYNDEAQLGRDEDSRDVIEPCPSDYTWNRKLHSCYKMTANRVSWRMARERCQVSGGDLVAIESDREQRYLNRLANESPETRHCDFWTSGTDVTTEGKWFWVSQNRPFTYHNWNHNEPNNGSGREHCMQMLWVFNWAWNDSNCKSQNACFICEIPQQA